MKKKEKIVVCELPDTYNSNPGLTFDKEYVILGEEDNKYLIVDDKGKKTTYYKNRFRTK